MIDKENIPVLMVLEKLSEFREYDFPPGFRVRHYREGDKTLWAEVETAAGEFSDFKNGLARFEEEFEKFPEELKQRFLILENDMHQCIGTAMGWFGDGAFGPEYGRIHWVGIHPAWQGKGLAKPLVSRAMEIIRDRYEKAYLTTQTKSYKAIKIYLDFGFRPYLQSLSCRVAWKQMAELLGHQALEEYR